VHRIYEKAEYLAPRELRIIYAGKALEELTHEEAVACAAHFHRAHVETTAHNAKLLRRMKKMELVITKAQLARLDWWLSVHPPDVPKGDGSPRYAEWAMFELTDRGYQMRKQA
jgi:hypothetical protein